MTEALVIPISLFFPRIAVVVISSGFQEAGFVFFHQANATYPFGALPEIQMGNHHARRTAMRWRKRLIVIFECDEGLAVDDVGQGYVRSIATITIGSDEHSFAVKLNVLEQSIKTYTFPFHVEMRPLGNAGNIRNVILHWELEKLFPCP